MKRMLMLLMLILLLPAASYAEGETALLRHAVNLGWELDAMAENEERARQYTSEADVLAMIRSYGEGSHDEPCEIRAAVLDELMVMMGAELSELPDAGKRQVQNMLPHVVKQGYINTFGVKAVVANTILRASVTFAAEQAEGQGLWIMLYEEASPVAVSWYAENGAVHMEASFLPQASDLPFETKVIAAARPALDTYAQSIAAELQELAGNNQYLMLLGLSEEVLGTVRSYAGQEGQSPRLVLCALTEDAPAANVRLTQQIGYLGDAYLAAAGAMHAAVIFADADASGSGLYLFLYDEGAPIIVQWSGQNGAYHLAATFQPGEFPACCRHADEVNAWAESIGLNVRFQQAGAMLLP